MLPRSTSLSIARLLGDATGLQPQKDLKLLVYLDSKRFLFSTGGTYKRLAHHNALFHTNGKFQKKNIQFQHILSLHVLLSIIPSTFSNTTANKSRHNNFLYILWSYICYIISKHHRHHHTSLGLEKFLFHRSPRLATRPQGPSCQAVEGRIRSKKK